MFNGMTPSLRSLREDANHASGKVLSLDLLALDNAANKQPQTRANTLPVGMMTTTTKLYILANEVVKAARVVHGPLSNREQMTG